MFPETKIPICLQFLLYHFTAILLTVLLSKIMNDMNLNYTDIGHGKVVLLIHGFCESLNIWKNLEPQISQFNRVISVDLPGFGDSAYNGTPISIEWFSEEIISLLNDLKIESFSVIGHSLGGYVTLALADKYPERIDSFVLFHSTAFDDPEEKKMNRDKMASFIQRNGVEKFMNSFVSPLFAEENRTKCKAAIDELTEDGNRSQEEAVLGTIQAMRNRPDRRSVLTKFNKPILWIVGENDVAVHLNDSLEQLELGKLTQSIVLKNCGHMGMIEKPATTSARIIEFLS